MTIWCAQIGQVTLCFFSRAEQLCLEMNAYSTFHRGKSIEKYKRTLIIDDILSGGANVSTEYCPGSFRAIGSKYKVSGVTVSNVWKTFCQTGENFPLHAAARGQLKRLAEPELDLVQLLIKCRPSRTYKNINKENIEAPSMATAYNRPCCPRPLTEASRRKIHLDTLIECKLQTCWTGQMSAFKLILFF